MSEKTFVDTNIIIYAHDKKETNEILSIYKNWEIIDNTLAIFEKAVSLTQKYKLSFWDSSILSAAIIGRAVIIYTEDLNHGQKIEGITILNPFL